MPLHDLSDTILSGSLDGYKRTYVAVVDSGRSGGRSMLAALKLAKEGHFRFVHNVPGGVDSWVRSGFALSGVPPPGPERKAEEAEAKQAEAEAVREAGEVQGSSEATPGVRDAPQND